MTANDTSFSKAVEERKESHDTFFMDGWSGGMRQQRHNDLVLSEDIERLHTKLDSAVDAFEKSTAENERLRKELDWVKQRLAKCEESTASKAPFIFANNLPSHSSPSTLGVLGTGNRDSSAGPSTEPPRITSQHVDLRALWPPRNTVPHEVHTVYSMSSLNNGRLNQVDDLAMQSLSSYASVVSGHFPAAPASHYALHLPVETHLVTPDPTSEQPHSMTSRSPRDKLKAKYPKTMKELKDLMELAREPTSEGTAALSIVKNYCSRAHNTPREQKTFMQRWVLMNWKNPHATDSSASTAAADAKPNPRIDDPVDVWYEYLCAHPHSWPKGVRKDGLNRPIMSDLIANRAVARMRPTESAASRTDFVAHVTDIFAIPGMYKQLLEENGLTVTPGVSYQPFAGPINVETIVRHFAESGLTPAEAMKNFEPWAKHYKED